MVKLTRLPHTVYNYYKLNLAINLKMDKVEFFRLCDKLIS